MADTTDLTYRTNAYALTQAETDDPDLIRRQIDYTRAQLASTINEIGERLSPDNLIEQAKSSAKEATVGRIKDMTHQANQKVEGMSNSLGQTIRDNPLPVAVIGLGLGWLLLSERGKRDAYRMEAYDGNGRGYRYYGDEPYGRRDYREGQERMRDAADTVERKATEVKHRVGEAAQAAGEGIENTTHRIGETLSETASNVGESLSEVADRVGQTAETVQERAGEAATRTREEAERLRREAEWRSRMAARRTKQTFWQTMEESPLAVGAVLAIAGAAVGAAIPSTEYENKLMGETRDKLMDEARVRAQDAVGRVQSVVEDTQRAVVTEAKDAARRHNLNIDDTIGTDDSSY